MKATYNDLVLAESDDTVVIEGNQYFPADSVNFEVLKDSKADTTTVCPWKGTANYYDLITEDDSVSDIAWVYKNPSEAASKIKDYVAFYVQKGVEVGE